MLLKKLGSYFVQCQNSRLLSTVFPRSGQQCPTLDNVLHGDTNLAKMLAISHVLICLLQIFKREHLIFYQLFGSFSLFGDVKQTLSMTGLTPPTSNAEIILFSSSRLHTKTPRT